MPTKYLSIGAWQVDHLHNRITRADTEVELEPRVMDLLMLLAEKRGEVVSKNDIIKALWGDINVNDDALTRCVFKLRKALGDSARNPMYVGTVSKRGYRLLAEVSAIDNSDRAEPVAKYSGRVFAGGMAIVLAASLFFFAKPLILQEHRAPPEPAAQIDRIARADGFYSQFTRIDNESALRLYEVVLDEEPKNAAALAGLSNALTQREIRYRGPGSDGDGRRTLTEALASGWLDEKGAKIRIDRAVALARDATELDPSHERAWRALGLARSAQGKFEAAERAYERALIIAPDDWGTMINLSELSKLVGRPERSTPYLEKAWYAMERNYAQDVVSIRRWHSATGLAVAKAKVDSESLQEARLWFRRVLTRDPLNQEALRGLAHVLINLEQTAEAQAVCAELAAISDELC